MAAKSCSTSAAEEDLRAFLRAVLRRRFQVDDAPLHPEQLPPTIAELAQREGVAPLLYILLRGSDLPPAVEHALRSAYYASAARNLLLFRLLEDVLRALHGTGVPVILLKGAALAPAVYGNIALRPMDDLDLLVPQASLETTIRALSALGYAPSQPEVRPGILLSFENELVLRQHGAGTPLEVHWSLFDSPYYQQKLDLQWFWESALRLRFEDVPVQVLGPEAQLLYLAGHLFLQHGGTSGRLLWLHDLAEVLYAYRDRLDWNTVLEKAAAYDLISPLQSLLPYVAREWGAPVPEDVLARLREQTPSRAERRTIGRLRGAVTPGRRLWSDFCAQNSWRARMRFLWVHLFPSPDYMRSRYPAFHGPWMPFGYLYRWYRGIAGLLPRPTLGER